MQIADSLEKQVKLHILGAIVLFMFYLKRKAFFMHDNSERKVVHF